MIVFVLDLLKNKSRPEAAASEAAAWVVSERALKEKIKKEKEVKEKDRKEREVSFFTSTFIVPCRHQC